ncbi:transcriptional regulator [Coprococcus comes ATCC 27758]|uniref:Toxin-antitoxin system, antitoxin component, Xre family n=1 Tax=Coprococcus comes ATCC 27758 TaxID=470146 RepID=C0BC21_9FIRM|nr:transcriptional regulator [Coprococcus comes]EEG89645.1 toxin-antitoxin system, antitoxin component, Xre family [Coprococcus comes ATCC 27758]QRT50258.1 transcriptional regulator [Coprococcus comes]UWP12830.1 transcriptional regulator [Coprococcus comes ATCC 27758]
MKRENTAIRLKQLMQERSLKQVDILEMTKPYCAKYDVKMNKSDLSQYVSGKVEPNQDKLFVLSRALRVNEAWLMGFDVEKEKEFSGKEASKDIDLIQKFSLLNKRDQEIVMNMIDSMLKRSED